MNHEKIVKELQGWFQDKDLSELRFEYSHNGICSFSGTITHMPQYEYQWMYLEDGRYKITSNFSVVQPTPGPYQINWKRLDESKRISKCH